jgi:putative NADH-flavin reductase
MLFDGEGKSRISSEDYAVAMLDEVENPRHIRKRMTAAY